jgi:CRP-like cAMP-binding protein
MALTRSRAGTLNPKVEKNIHDIESAFAQGARGDPDAFLSKLKPLFKDCSELKAVPVHYRGEVRAMQLAALMSLGEVEAGTVVVSEGSVSPDLYIVVRGALEAKSSRSGSYRQGILIKPFESCGFVTPLTGLEWVPCALKAVERTEFITIARDLLSSFVAKIDHIKEIADLKDFVVTTVPGAKYLGLGGKEKIISYFRKVTFKKGDVLLREGLPTNYAYILRSGECLKTSSGHKGNKLHYVHAIDSKTTANLMLSLVTPRQWIGEECLIYGNSPDYTVTAVALVHTLRIDKDTFNEKLPKETIHALKLHADSKKVWKTMRQQKVKETLLKAINASEEPEGLSNRSNSSRRPIAQVASASILKRHMADRSLVTGTSASPIRVAPSKDNSCFLTDKLATTPSPPRSVTGLLRSEIESRPQKSPLYTKTRSLQAASFPRTRSVKTVRRYPSPTKPILLFVQEHFGYKDLHPLPEAETYIQHLLRPRPPSPNPAEAWARRYHLDPSSLKQTLTPARQAV